MAYMRLAARYSFEVVDSTNKEARRYAGSGGALPALFVANAQTEGRGRLGRSFYSPAQTGLYMTLLLDVTSDRAESVTKITSLAAVAVTDALRDIAGVDSQIKWVNDIYIDGRKVCGILAEGFWVDNRRYVCIGVGINLDTAEFPPDISHIAGSVGVPSTDALKERIAGAVADRILELYDLALNGNTLYMDTYRERSAVLGKRISFIMGEAVSEGLASGIDDDGGLLVLLDSGRTVTLSSGEITVRFIKETEN